MNAAVVKRYFIFAGTNGLAINERVAGRDKYKHLNHAHAGTVSGSRELCGLARCKDQNEVFSET